MASRASLPHAALAFILLAAAQAYAPASAAAEGSPWHTSLDVALARSTVHFVSTGALIPGCTEGCGPSAISTRMLRGSFGFGLGGLSAEASLARPVNGDAGDFVYSLGVRLDTSYRAHVSLGIRGAYLRRFGQAPGRGGRFSALLQIRIVDAFVFYGEGGLDVTTVSQNMSDNGAILAYGTQLTFGARVVFGP